MCRNIQWALRVGVPHSPVQPSPDQTYGGEKCDLVADGYYVGRPTISVVNMYRLFFLSLLPKQYTYNNCLHSIYIILCIISNLEMIESIQENMRRLAICKYYAIYKRLKHAEVWYVWVPLSHPPQ